MCLCSTRGTRCFCRWPLVVAITLPCILRREDLYQSCDQGWQIASDNLPENIKINGVITVDESIAKTYYLGPGDLRIGGPLFSWNPSGSLADDFHKPDQCQIEESVRVQVLAAL